MEDRNCDLMIAYWNSLRRGPNAPAQSDIEPRSISRVLPSVFILDASIPTHPTYRLAGTALCKRFGCELRNKSYLDHWDAPSSEALRVLLRRALKAHRPISLYSVDCCLDAGPVELESVLAPISIKNGEPTRFIGMAQVLNKHAQLTASSSSFQNLSASHLICESELSAVSSYSFSQLSFAEYPLSNRTDAARWKRA
jgi:hypothetical protein